MLALQAILYGKILKLNLPTKLTLIRLILSPLLVPLLFIYFLPANNSIINIVLALIFLALSLTDFFDGYLARKYQQESAIGTILDPIADKFLIYSTLIALLVVHKIFFLWVVLLIGREFFMMGLRQVALEYNFSIKVSYLGKIKTTVQFIWLTWVIINPYQAIGYGLQGAHMFNAVEVLLLVSSVVLSITTAYVYYTSFIDEFNARLKRSLPENGTIK